MMKSFEVHLDIENELYTPSNILFSASRNDFETIHIDFIITHDNEPFDLTNKTVELGVKKPSGKTVYQAVQITNALQGTASAILTVQAYVEYGVHSAEIYIRDMESILVTSPFYFMGRESIIQFQEIESVDDWSVLQQIMFAYDRKPILTEGMPTVVPEYAGQTALDIVNKLFFVANDVTVDSWVQIDTDVGAITWDMILEKPLTFPSESHTHLIADVNGLQEALNAKANSGEIASHSHEILDVNLLQEALDGKVDDAELAGKADVNHTHAFGEITNRPITYPPEAHTHAIADVEGLGIALDGKLDNGEAYLKSETYNKTEVYNKTEIDQKTMAGGGTVVEDNLTSTSSVNALSANQGRILNETKANANHSHAVADVTGLQTTLTNIDTDITALTNDKANKAETYSKAESDSLFLPQARIWTGTRVEYDAIATKEPTTLYFITGA